MKKEQLQAFVHVAQNLSFARAAEALYKTQPSISHQIASLEAELDTKLFLRNKQGVHLTEAGEQFYEDAVRILHDMEIAVDNITERRRTYENIFSVGFACVSEYNNLCYDKALEKFRYIHPNCIPAMGIYGHKKMVSLFRANKLDCMFIKEYELKTLSNFRFEALSNDNAHCVMPKDHPLASKGMITLDEMAQYPLILCDPLVLSTSLYGIQDELIKRHGPSKIFYSTLEVEALSLIRAGYGISPMRSMIVPHDNELVSIPIQGATQHLFGIAWRKNESLKEILDFVKVVKKECKVM